MPLRRDEPPQVEVQPLACLPTGAADRWRCAWVLASHGPHALVVEAAWLPHGRFRAVEAVYDPPLCVPPGERARLERVVSCRGAPGEVVENAFLILRVRWNTAAWRVLARLTIAFDAAARPAQSLALLTVQPVGFAD